jgi:quercetin dioxygenase-like cupin family protein
MRSQTFVESADSPWTELRPGVERQILAYEPALMLMRVRYAAGAVGPAHHHPHRQVSYVESGVFEVEVAGEKRTLRPGDSFIVEPDAVHGVVTQEGGTLVEVFTPYREEFLP